MRLAAVTLCLFAAACDPGLTHRCTTSTQCVRGGEQGVCEVTGRCSFGDASCPSGRRYSEWAGEVAHQCVEGASPDAATPDGTPDGAPDAAGGPPDGRADARPTDAAPDAASVDSAADGP